MQQISRKYNPFLLYCSTSLGTGNSVTVLRDGYKEAGSCFPLTVFLICTVCLQASGLLIAMHLLSKKVALKQRICSRYLGCI